MTLEGAGRLELHSKVRLFDRTGKVSQITPRRFMVTWDGSDAPEVVRRDRNTILLGRLTAR